MNRHLVTIEVGVEGRADERMKLYGLALYQYRIKGLNTETMKGGCAVKKDRMFLYHLFERVPDFRFLLFDKLLCLLDGRSVTLLLELVEYKRFEEFQCHHFGETTLVKIKVWADNDNRT